MGLAKKLIAGADAPTTVAKMLELGTWSDRVQERLGTRSQFCAVVLWWDGQTEKRKVNGSGC